MQVFTLLLAYVACTSNARRTQAAVEHLPVIGVEDKDERTLPQALANLFLALPTFGQNPSVGIHASHLAVPSRSKDVQLLLNKLFNKVMDKEDGDEVPLGSGILQGQRYIANNRFFVKEGKEAAFEQRWATRKSRLAELPGFNFFVMLRRSDPVPDEPNYISFTIWDNKEFFTAWRTGEAFKEAHGGTSIGAFVNMMVSASQTLKGKPKLALYDGLLPIVSPVENMPESVNGWRKVDADGIDKLDTEVFVAMNRFSVMPGNEVAFEQRWQRRESKLRECDGFVSFYLMRRDPPESDDGYNYVSTTVWRDRAAFDAWRAAQAPSHGQGASGESKSSPSIRMMKGPPSVAFYEGILTLYAPDYNVKAGKELAAA